MAESKIKRPYTMLNVLSISSEASTIPANGYVTFTCQLSSQQQSEYNVLGAVGFVMSSSVMRVVEMTPVGDKRVQFYVYNNSPSALSDARVTAKILVVRK